jgi:hypothetical protein
MDPRRRPIHKKPLVNLIRGADTPPVLLGESVVGQRLLSCRCHKLGGRVHPGGAQVFDDGSRLPVGGARQRQRTRITQLPQAAAPHAPAPLRRPTRTRPDGRVGVDDLCALAHKEITGRKTTAAA